MIVLITVLHFSILVPKNTMEDILFQSWKNDFTLFFVNNMRKNLVWPFKYFKCIFANSCGLKHHKYYNIILFWWTLHFVVNVKKLFYRPSPPGPDENLGCLDKFFPITYKYFIISSKLGQIFCIPGPIFILSPPLTASQDVHHVSVMCIFIIFSCLTAYFFLCVLRYSNAVLRLSILYNIIIIQLQYCVSYTRMHVIC